MAGTFARWTKEGQLATAAMVIVFATWLSFQLFVGVAERPTVLNEMLMTMAGIWMGNIMFAQGRKDDARDRRLDVSESRMRTSESRSTALEVDMGREQKRNTALEKRASTSEDRADDSQERESGWSRHKDHAVEDGFDDDEGW